MWYPSSISCPEQTADKHRTPAVGPEVYQQQHPTEGEPPLPVLSWDPRGDGQDSESQGHLRWDVIPRTCWGSAATHSVFHLTQLSQHVSGTGSTPPGRRSPFPKTSQDRQMWQHPRETAGFPCQAVPGWRGQGSPPPHAVPGWRGQHPTGMLDVPGWRGEQVPLPGPSQGGVAAPHRHPVCPPALTRSRGRDTSGSRGRRRGSGAA